MADHIEPAPDIHSSGQSSAFSDVLGDTKVRRSLVKISSEQKELLAGHKSWESLLSQRPNGFINVPSVVLDQLKALYTQQKRATESHKRSRSTSHTGDDIQVSEPSRSQLSWDHHAERNDEDGSDGVCRNRTSMSWSLSPERCCTPPNAESNEPSQAFMTQLPENSPPQPTILTSPDHIQPPDVLQSSQGLEDELEVEVPAALTHCPIPVNKSAFTMQETPPSAQIPCTFEQSTQSLSTDASAKLELQSKLQPKQAVYKALPQLYHRPKHDAISLSFNPNVGASEPVVDPKEVVALGSSSSSGNTSASFIPSTVIDGQRLESKRTPARDTTLPSQNFQSFVPSRSPSPTHISPTPRHVTSSPQVPPSVSRPVVPPIAGSGGREASFAQYIATYPSYGGTVQDFVTACSYIQGQHHRIRTSLYDDFIRAWVQGYLPYVEECDSQHPSRQALEAIEWYNGIDDDPLYTSRVVTRLNLPSVLRSYPNETKTVQTYIRILSSQPPSEQLLSQSQAGPNVRENEPNTPETQPYGKEPIREPSEAPAGTSMQPPAVKPTKPPYPANPNLSSHESLDEVETRQEQPKALTRSIADTSTRKRPADNELSSEATKRVARPSTQSDNITTTPKSTRRAYTATPDNREEKRKQRLAKYFKKRMAGQKT